MASSENKKARLSLLCTFGLAAVCLTFLTGCPQQCPDGTDEECDNGFFCDGEETCGADLVCEPGTPPCDTAAGETCSEDNDDCVGAACTTDAECDDDDVCDGVETCGDDGFCADDTPLDCDDNDACTDDSCDSASGCVNAAVDCSDGDNCTTDTCDPADGCVNTAIDCDDGVACTDDTCDAGVCANTDNCAAGSACNEDTGECVLPCDNAEDCDDADDCTDDACVNGACSNTAMDCDDGVACTDDTCDAGVCSSADNCTPPQTCNTTSGMCEEVPACETDADCAETPIELFCNGIATCDVDTGDCVAGARPCDDNNDDVCPPDGDATETCAEGDDAAFCTVCPPITLDFTLAQDNLTGTTAGDTFSAVLEFNAGTGTQVATLQTGDSANGLAGADVLNASVNGTAAVPTLAGIETMNVTAFAATTITGTNISGVDEINSLNSTATLTITGMQELSNVGLSGITDGVSGLAITFATAATTGSADAITTTLTGSTAGTVTITTGAANGFETLNVTGAGAASTLTAVTQATGTTMATANFAGAGNVTVNTIPSTLLTIAGGTMTGNLQLGTGTTAATHVGFASVANNLTDLDTGTGSDTIIFGTQFNTNDFSSATVDLGAGTDIVQAAFAADYGTAMPFRNVEEFRFNCTTASTVNMTSITAPATLTNDADGTATAITLQNVPATAGVFPTLNYRGDSTQAAQTYDTVTYAATGATGSGDVLNINVANRGTALNSGTATTNVHTVGLITGAGFETVNLDVADGPATLGGITASTLVSFDADASSNLTLGTVGQGAGTPALVTIDCSGVSGNLSATFDFVASGASLTTAGGNDTVTIGVSSTATTLSVSLGAGNDSFIGDSTTDCAETVTAGAGADTVQAEGGNATISSGDGADTILYTETGTAEAADSCDDTTDACSNVADFTAGSGGDVLKFDISDLGLAGGTEFVGLLAGVAAAATDEIVILTGVGYASNSLMEDALAVQLTGAGTENMVIIYFNTAASQTWIVLDTDAPADNPDTTMSTLGKLTNITTQAVHDTLTTANIDSQS